jgi:hypothetical protein
LEVSVQNFTQLGGCADFFMSFYLKLCIWPETDQKQQRVNVCKELRQIASDDATFLSRVITGDESRIYGYDHETKQQFSQWKMKSKVKGIVHKEFVLAGQTVKSAYYCDILQ